MGVSASTIALCHGHNKHLVVHISSMHERRDLAIISDYINHEQLRKVLTSGRSYIDNAILQGEYDFLKGRDVKSIVCVPFLAKDTALGLVLIEHSVSGAFTDENVSLLEIIAQQVSIAIDNARLYQQMQDLATLDGLTGAYNRIHFQNRLSEEIKIADLQHSELACIMCDIA